MEVVTTIFSLLSFFCLAMLIASFFTARAALFAKTRTKKKGPLMWLGLVLLCFVIVGATDPKSLASAESSSIPAISPTATTPDESSAIQDDTSESDYDEEVLAARKAMAARAEEVKPELEGLFNEFEAMRTTRQFKDFGFSVKNQVAVGWKKRVEEARTRLEADPYLPVEVKLVPVSLLSYSNSMIWSKGQFNSEAEWHLEMIQAGLNWGLENQGVIK